MRKLVTLRKIDNILTIDNSDNIEQVMIDGWKVVCSKGIHNVGDQVLFFEIDSFLPLSDSRFEGFMKHGLTKFEGKEGHKVKTKKIRGVYSQGIIMPLIEFPEISEPVYDTDYSQILDIKKFERNECTGNPGDVKEEFPSFLRKTEQQRIQNIYNKLVISSENLKLKFASTMKVNGSSVSVFCKDGKVGICSRNMELKYDPTIAIEGQGRFVRGAINSDLFAKLETLYKEIGDCCLQGELVGPGVQGNYEKFEKYEVLVYNIFSIKEQRYYSFKNFEELCCSFNIKCVPVINPAIEVLSLTLEDLIKMADGPGIHSKYREGVVFKSLTTDLQFKAISNKFLEKQEDF